ncbi:MAG TPA: ABC transporter permease [Gemmatimonadaceae bacterium]|nr:ABC transporter permease [Gemmatimonadaceae bacterium]
MRRLFRFPWRRARDIRADVDAELRFHIDARTEALIAGGLAADTARAQATREFGDVDDARRYINALDRDTEAARRRRDYMDDLRQDITYALRKLRTSPAFTITAVVTLALGIGANTAIFSVVNGVLLRPLPFPHAEQLVRIWSANKGANSLQVPASVLDVDDWRAQRQKLADIGAYFYQDGASGVDLTGAGDPQRISAAFVTPGFFTTLGVGALEGRVPNEGEMARGGNDRVAMLSHGFWVRQFGGQRSVVGSKIILGGEPYQVLGVMPPSFTFPDRSVELWIPYSSIPDDAIPHIRPVRVLGAFARMKPGVTLAEAQAEMNLIAGRLARQYPDDDGSYAAATVMSLQESITGKVRTGLLVLLGAVVFVLLMACVNVANLLLARASVREREITVRLALGAGRGRVVRQLLTESVILALAGGVAGLLVARGGVAALLVLSAGQLPRGQDVRIDGTVLAFALGLSVVTGLVFGLVPALRASSPRLQGALREGGRGMAGSAGYRLRNGLVIAQVALAAMLAVGAGLMTKSLVRLLNVDAGFRPDHLVAVMFTISTSRHPNYTQFYHEVIEKVRTVPGVIAAGAVRDAPFRGSGESSGFLLPGMTLKPGEQRLGATFMFISDGYFNTIGAPMIAGREFAPEDRPGGIVPVVVNAALAKKYFPGQTAVGKTLLFGGQVSAQAGAQIVGVVGDIRQSAMDEPAAPTIYVNNLFNSRVKTTLVARTQGDALATARAMRSAIWSLDRDQPITAIFTFDDVVSGAVARPRLLTVLLGVFGVLGLVLGSLGIYGVLAYLVNQRQRAIGVRIALGASPGGVSRMIVRRGLTLTAAGAVIGLAGALALGRFLSGVLFGVQPSDPLTFVGMTAVLIGVAAVASWLPARRAGRVDPVVALRGD